jgi:DNA-binding response OmpR family regulator
MAKALQEALSVLDRAAQLKELRQRDLALAARVLDDLPALAWDDVNAGGDRRSGAPAELTAPAGHLPIAVLVVGDEALAEALAEEAMLAGRALECERSADVGSAQQLARAYAPDLLLIDADLPGAPTLVEALLDDPLTEPVPIVAVGTFPRSDDQARLIALGVAKTLPKPASPDVVRGTCEEVLEGRDGRTVRMTLGEPTLQQLAERLSDELRRALVDDVEPVARSQRIPLGEGTEVLGALWGAIARVQELVAERTGGAIRFGGEAPEGTIALAPSLHQELPASDRMAGRRRSEAAYVRMNGRRVVVADDDPGVTWFISDLLRTAGCEVHEALDGNTALERTLRTEPDLVVSDILMPGLDGFALSRALRRDVALRDTPVILLSWKEDLLQRVHELGASAAAYMRKEADSRAILARVREVLRPRARIEMRLRSEGEVRGRLDGLSPRLLLHLVCTIRKNARLGVRDASFLYEIDIRGGIPRKATRTASDGSYQTGEMVLASLLGVGAGRFVVSTVTEPVRGDLLGSLFDQLARPIAAARGALAATTGACTVHVERIGLDAGGLEDYLRATPDPAHTLIRHLAEGASPRRMLIDGEVSPSLLEDVLTDLSARGAIRSVEGAFGEDLLSPAVEAARAVIGVAPQGEPRTPANATPSAFPPPVAILAAEAMRVRQAAQEAKAHASTTHTPTTHEAPVAPAARDESSGVLVQFDESSPAARVESAAAPSAEDDGAPSSLEDAVIREISDRSPHPGGTRPTPQLPPIVEPSELRPRSSNPPGEDETLEGPPLPSIPPDAIVPDTLGSDTTAVAAAAANFASEAAALTPPLPMPADVNELATAPTAILEWPGSADAPSGPESHPAASETDDDEAGGAFGESSELARMADSTADPFPLTKPRSPREPQERLPPHLSHPRKATWHPLVLAFIVLGVAVAAALLVAERGPDSPGPAPAARSAPAP